MRRSIFFWLIYLTTSGLSAAERPNIIVILSDDMGYSDIAPYGGEIETPTLSRLAENGLRFTQFYNTARCCPTRACLLTGLYPHRAGIGHMMNDRGYPGYQGDLNDQCVTIAEVLKPAGYSTYAVGKWHVTPYIEGDKQHNWPLQRGFERYYGIIHGAANFYDPTSLVRDNTLISPFADPEYQPETYYFTHAISDHAVRFIDEHYKEKSAADKPFFMYVAYTAAHWPMHALPQDIAKYRGRYDDGYGAMRDARLTRMKELGLIDGNWEMTPQAKDWNAVENKAWETRCMEVYAAMVDSMDQGIGQIVKTLEQNDQLDNTLIFFMQDNGGCAEEVGRRQPEGPVTRPDAPTLPPVAATELQLHRYPEQTRDGYPVRRGPGVMPGPADTFVAYGEGWANVSNTPFREYKHWVHEGGISTPLIAHWPAGIARRGEFDSQPGHLIDIMATCVDVADAEYPEHRGKQTVKPIEGRSLVPAFSGNSIQRDAIYWEHEGNRAIRVGDWKLVAKANRPWELYNMQSDRTEMHDLADKHPEKVKELSEKWQAWAARSEVLPLGAWKGQPKKKAGNRQRKQKG